jgi:hypothetical protein
MDKNFYISLLGSIIAFAFCSIVFLLIYFTETKEKGKIVKICKTIALNILAILTIMCVEEAGLLTMMEAKMIGGFWNFKLIWLPSVIFGATFLLFTVLPIAARTFDKLGKFLILSFLDFCFWFGLYFAIYSLTKIF